MRILKYVTNCAVFSIAHIDNYFTHLEKFSLIEKMLRSKITHAYFMKISKCCVTLRPNEEYFMNTKLGNSSLNINTC